MKLLKFYIRKHYREEKKVVINKLLKLCLKTRENYVLFKNKKCMWWSVQGIECLKYSGSMYSKQFASVFLNH